MQITDRSRRGRAAVAAALLVVVAAGTYLLNRTSPQERQELSSVPGTSVSREGVSTQTELFVEALTLLGRRNFVGAESVYREVLAVEPLSAPAYVGIGTARFQQNDLAGAQKHYARALELDRTSTAASLGLGSVAYSQRRYQVAEKYYRQALGTRGSEADAHWGLGLTYDAQGQASKAVEHYGAYMRLAPGSGQVEIARTRIAVLQSHATRAASGTNPN
jgi:tetratricopeptide (TPR) repeat protein